MGGSARACKFRFVPVCYVVHWLLSVWLSVSTPHLGRIQEGKNDTPHSGISEPQKTVWHVYKAIQNRNRSLRNIQVKSAWKHLWMNAGAKEHEDVNGQVEEVTAFFCFQELRGELLRSAAVHRLPAGSGLEVDPRAQRVSRQLLLGAVPVPPQRWHHAQLGESLLHTFTNVALTRVTLFHGKNERECEECPSCSLQYNKWNGKTCPKMHHKQRFRLKTKPLSLRPICLETRTTRSCHMMLCVRNSRYSLKIFHFVFAYIQICCFKTRGQWCQVASVLVQLVSDHSHPKI